MIKRINLESGVVQYIVGLAVNLGFLLLLLSLDSTYRNLQVPEGQFVNNKNDVSRSDLMAYVGPARNYLTYGVIGNGPNPTDYRVVGYHAFLAATMWLFGPHWLTWTYFIQAGLFASIYPALLKIAQILFKGKHGTLKGVFAFSLVSTAYVAHMPAMYSDLFFTALFLVGLCFAMLSIVRQSWPYLILQSVFIGYAAQTRPILALYPIVHCLVLISVARLYRTGELRKTKWLIWVSTAALVVLCNLPSLRNYVNHGHLQPATMVHTRLVKYIGDPVLLRANAQDRIDEFRKNRDRLETRQERRQLGRRYVINACIDYPWATLQCLGSGITGVMSYSHWFDLAAYWGDYSIETDLSAYRPFQNRYVIVSIKMLSNVAYFVVYLFCLLFLVRLLREKKMLFCATIVVFLSYLLIPTFIGGGGPRMRLPVEGIMVMFAFYEIGRLKVWRGRHG